MRFHNISNAAKKSKDDAHTDTSALLHDPVTDDVEKHLKGWKNAMCCWAIVSILATFTQVKQYHERTTHHSTPRYYDDTVPLAFCVNFYASIMTFIRCIELNYTGRLDQALIAPPFDICSYISLFGNFLLGYTILNLDHK